VSERKNRHLLEITRALLFSAHLPKTYWADAVLTGCYLINRLLSRILDFQSPMEILYNRKFNLSHLRVFGCVCYVHSQNAGKLDSHAQKCIFVGYSSTQKEYRCYDPKQKRVFISRDVRFDESKMFYATENQGEKTAYKDFQIVVILVDHQYGLSPIPVDHQYGPNQLKMSSNDTATRDGPNSAGGTNSTYEDSSTSDENKNTPSRPESGGSPMADSRRLENEEVHVRTSPVRRSTRITKQPAKFQDFVTYHTTLYPIQEVVRYDKVSPKLYFF
jgi:hypothetical protein